MRKYEWNNSALSPHVSKDSRDAERFFEAKTPTVSGTASLLDLEP